MTYLRRIITDNLPMQPLREQPAPTLAWLRIADLRVDERYQRQIDARGWAAIHKIAKNFDWTAFSPVLCAPLEGGLFAVIDGQHRAHAAQLCGIEKVPGAIVPVPANEQAMAFVRVNSAIAVSSYQTFRAELAAGNPEAQEMARACSDAGCEAMTFKPGNKSRQPRRVFFLGLVRSMVRAGRADTLTTALRALVAYDQNGRAALYSDYILRPLTDAIDKTGVRSPELIAAALRTRDPFHTLEEATRLAIEHGKPAPAERRDRLAIQILRATTGAA